MREQLLTVRSLKYISIAQTAVIVYLVGLFIYLLANVGQGSSVTITPPVTISSPAVTLPNSTQKPVSNSAVHQTNLHKI